MAGKTDVFSNDFLKLVFWGTPIANLADNAATSPLASLYLSLHTADPTDSAASGQATNEVTYTGYVRKAAARSNAAWSISGKVANPVAPIDFDVATAGVQTATHWGIGTSATGNGKLLYSGTLTPSVAIQTGVIPRITAASTVTED
jgi:hypothetical protein